MTAFKHLTLDDRCTIQMMLDKKASFAEIGRILQKDPSTISKEVRTHLIFRRVGGMHLNYNACIRRFDCSKSRICAECHSQRRYSLCRRCSMCNAFCRDFEAYSCPRLDRPPYVCNACGSRATCSLEKRFYKAQEAHREYRDTLSDSRSGFSFSEEEIRFLDQFITPLIQKNQSPHHICATNKDSLMVSERTVYRLIDSRAISAMNMDLPRKIRYRARKKTVPMKVDRACRIGRGYDDFLSFMEASPDTPVTQLDSVEGVRSGAALLTIHFVKAELMLAFLRGHNDSRSVIDIFERLYLELRPDRFMEIFKVCLADNGSEFSNPSAIEFDCQGNRRTHLFYCDPYAPYQKGSAERNHEFLRCFIPKGYDFSAYSQADITLMMDHINSYARKSLGGKCPYDMFRFLYGQEMLDLLGCHRIPANDVTLNQSIFHKEGRHDVR